MFNWDVISNKLGSNDYRFVEGLYEFKSLFVVVFVTAQNVSDL